VLGLEEISMARHGLKDTVKAPHGLPEKISALIGSHCF